MDDLEAEALDVFRRLLRLARRALTRPEPAPAPLRDEVLAAAEAHARGFASTEAFLSWCETRGVAVRVDGNKLRWVRPEAVSRAIAGMPVRGRSEAANDVLEATGLG